MSLKKISFIISTKYFYAIHCRQGPHFKFIICMYVHSRNNILFKFEIKTIIMIIRRKILCIKIFLFMNL